MATVPISQGASVESRPVAFVPQQANFTPDAFGAGIGQATQQVGGAIAKDSSELSAVADHMAQQQALRSAKGADMQAENGLTDINYKSLPGGPEGNKGYFSLKGQDAVTYAPAYQKAIDDLHSQVSDSLGDNPRAQTLFSVQSAQRKAAAYNASARYAVAQGEVADDAASSGRIEAYTNTFTNTPNDPAALQRFQQVVNGEASDYGRRHGLGDDATKAYATALLSKGYKDGVLSLATNGDVQGAAGLFKQVAPSMDAATRVGVAQHLEPLVRGAVADNWVSDQMGKAVPANTGSVADAIHGQESGGSATSVTSVDGARGGWQITPATFHQYAREGESIDNSADNERVGRRIIDDLSTKYNGDAKRIAVGYFSGPGNVSPAGSANPWINDKVDGNGFSTSRYVAGVLGRMHGAPQTPAGDASDANPALHPDFAGMVQQAQDTFGSDPKTRDAVISRIHTAAGQYELSTQADRDQIQKSWKDTVAAAGSGMDNVSVDEAKIRHVFRPAVADAMMGEFDEAVTGGQLVSSLKLSSPAQDQAIVANLAAGLGPKATLDHLRGKAVVANEGTATATEDETPDQFRQRMKFLNVAQTAIAQKNKMLADDPASYAMQDPNVASAFQAVNPQDPKSLQAAVDASMSTQRSLGVPAGEERTLSNSQAAAMVKKIHTTTPENGDMGKQLTDLQAQYGDHYPGVIADMTKAGLDPDYQMLAHANAPGQETVNADLQRALQQYDGLKDKKEFGKSVPEDQMRLIKPAIDAALEPYRETIKPYGNTSTYDAVVVPSITKLATYYAGKGYPAADAVERASQLVTKSYDFDGMLRTPKGQLSAVQQAGSTMQSGLTDADLRGTTAAEARRGTWVTNTDDAGATLMKGTSQGGFMPVRKVDGSYVSMSFKNLPTAAPVQASINPMPVMQ